MKQIYDISPVLSEETPVWPGDVSLSRRHQRLNAENEPSDVWCLSTPVHIGAHTDAPCHYVEGGESVDLLDLADFMGPCLVIDCQGVSVVGLSHFAHIDLEQHRRVLVKTRTEPLDGHFDHEYAYFAPELIEYLGKLGVRLIGIDSASVDGFSVKGMPAHRMLHKYNMRNLEGLDLSKVTAGVYELIALPLKLKGFDGSPVRAILRDV